MATVRDLRRQVDEGRSELALALAAAHVALGQPQKAIPPLRQARRRSPRREDLIKALVAAYLQCGQPESAERVRAGEEV